MKSRKTLLSSVGLLGVALGSWLPACDDNGCEDATRAMQTSITSVCHEPGYANTPFCTCCVPHGYFAIDDTCECKRLVFDADFCQYDSRSSGYPNVRRALDHAASVCRDRSVTVPEVFDGGTALCHGYEPDAGSGGTTGSGGSAGGGETGGSGGMSEGGMPPGGAGTER